VWVDGCEEERPVFSIWQDPEPDDRLPGPVTWPGASRDPVWPAASCVVRNLTPAIVHAVGRDGWRLRLPPLGRQELSRTELEATFDVRALTSDGRVTVGSPVGPSPSAWLPIAAAVVTAAAGLVVLGALQGLDARVTVPLVVSAGLATAWLLRGDRIERRRTLRQRLSLGLVLAIGLGLPAAAIVYATGLRGLTADEAGVVLVARAIQWSFIGLASLLPVLLYYLFDRVELGTLSDRFVRQVFRLNPALETLHDVESRYGRQMAEVYGPPGRMGRRLGGGRRSPLVVASLLLSTGWTAILLNPVLPETALDGDWLELITTVLRPAETVVAYAFLGAYLFSVELLVRGYVRGDLRPKTYTRAAARIVVAVVLGYVLELLPGMDAPAVLLVAFVGGAFPDWLLKLIVERVRRLPVLLEGGSGGSGPAAGLGTPVTVLDEIGMYDKTALADEGIDNVEALAHCDLIDLIIQTRLPTAQVVDWVDQAILHLHAHHVTATLEPARGLWECLRGCGIRTASGFIRVMDAEGAGSVTARNGRTTDTATDVRARHSLHASLGLVPGEPSPLDLVRTSLADEEWLPNIFAWREQTGPPPALEIVCPAASGDDGPAPQPDEILLTETTTLDTSPTRTTRTSRTSPARSIGGVP
jgi:hypothetical protein